MACSASAILLLPLAACAPLPQAPSPQHLEPAMATPGQAPDFIRQPPLPPPPAPAAAAQRDTYSIAVHDIDARELLFVLVRDGKLNADIHPGIRGTVTMNAIDQSLPEILERIAEQVDMRYKISDRHLSVQPDAPYLKNYRVDYPNIQRNVQSTVSTSTSLGASGSPAIGNTGSAAGNIGSGAGNSSTTTVSNAANNRFWETMIANLRDLLHETDKILPAGSSETVTEQSGQQTASLQPGANAAALPNPGNRNKTAARSDPLPATLTQQGTSVVRHTTFREAASVIANPETGIVSVRATERQHKKVREFLDGIMSSARRQVLIEATIVEVDLSERYQQGIDWRIVRKLGSSAGSQITLQPDGPYTSSMATGGLVGSLATLNWQKARSGSDINAAIKLLESFGTLRVLSSPKISVLNSQSSLLKVVDNEVYFTITATAGTAATATTPAIEPTYQTSVNTVPIGFLMSVTPQISASGEVILNLRPTISRISGYALDPNPVLAANNLSNPIPIIQTREMESLMRVRSGDIAILGGLMQDARNDRSDEVPGLNRVPAVGELFRFRDNLNRKSELVVFLRPTVLDDANASLEGDFVDHRHLLSDARSAFDAPAAPHRH
ncbi:conserved protein of unknown function [Sterolibacterium denitrificans]|uniref:Type II/III secretion system secretin-like domain-containing protein n=1 Tax=Sterolibacterium denitrificans TaxID=157592 RepID=A0A7Z7HR05_9PROT|nr:pilus (MSHA type) biogenesis protein MshL [Sterolibacterium denitrificans]SMB24258.1 conserved protein of unknown function [Sterolibacterium denitrificans]